MIAPQRRRGKAYPEDQLCSIQGCMRPAKKRDVCVMHYDRWRRRGNLAYEAQPVKNLQVIRQGLGLSQRQLAEEIGVGKSSIWNMERGGGALHSTVRKVHIGIRRLLREKREREARKPRGAS